MEYQEVAQGSSKLNFLDFRKKANDPNSVWVHFLREEKGLHAQCKECKTVLKTAGSTSSLHVHLRTKHKIVLKIGAAEKSEVESDHCITLFTLRNCSRYIYIYIFLLHVVPTKKRGTTIEAYFPKDDEKCLSKTIARMVALDGFPFSVFCTSMDLRDALNSRGFSEPLPKSPTTIRKLFMDYASKIRKYQISKIEILRNTGVKFSIVFDEWTSSRNRRYMNLIITAGGSELWDLGLIRIKGCILLAMEY